MYNAPNAARGVEALTAEIARGLKTQYLIGFKSTRLQHDGKRLGSQSESQFSGWGAETKRVDEGGLLCSQGRLEPCRTDPCSLSVKLPLLLREVISYFT